MTGLSISGSLIHRAEEAAENRMRVPDTARASTRNPEVKFWEEAGTITAAFQKKYPNEQGLDQIVLTYETTCSAEGSGLNIGFPIRNQLRFCPDAMATGSPENLAKMSMLSINRLTALLRAIGFPPDEADGGYSKQFLDKCFPPDDAFPSEPSPLISRTIRFEVKNGPTDGRDGKRRWFPEIVTIFETV